MERIDLKRIREEKGFSLDKVHEDLKIPKRVLQAIEEGDLSDLFISQVYVKGFAKSYARYLGVDPDVVVRQLFDEDKTLDNPSKQVSLDLNRNNVQSGDNIANAGKILNKILDVLLDILAVIVAVVIRFFSKLSPRKFAGLLILFVGLLGMWWIKDISVPNKGKVKKIVSKDSIGNRNGGSQNLQEVPVNVSTVSSDTNVSVSRKKESFDIIVEVSDNCWMRVKSDGVEVYRGVLHSGDIEKWSAKQSISLWVGNAGVVSVRCGDKTYPKLGKKGQVVREIVFSPDCSYRKIR